MPLSGTSTLSQQILDETADGVLVTDQSRPGSPIVYANATFCRMTGYPLEEVLGRNCRFLQGADREQPEIAFIREAVSIGCPVMATLRNYRQDGSMFWNEIRLAPLRELGHPDTRPRYFVGFQRDVTARVSSDMELRRALRTAEEANAAKLRFLKAMGHEFRTPIGIIVGFSDLLIDAAERGPLEARQLTYLEDIRGAANHLLTLMEDARRYLQLTSPADLKRERVSLSCAIEGVAQRLETVLHHLGVGLHIAAHAQDEVEADLPVLQQALENLITELARRAGRGSDVEVALRTDKEQAVVEMRCPTLILPAAAISGPGHPLEDGNVFNRGLEGAGVALVVAERIIRFHGGELKIQNEPNNGTVIRLTLPRAGGS